MTMESKFSKIRPFFDTQMLSEYFTFLRKNEINGVFKKIQKITSYKCYDKSWNCDALIIYVTDLASRGTSDDKRGKMSKVEPFFDRKKLIGYFTFFIKKMK